jgi:hypothetical protein
MKKRHFCYWGKMAAVWICGNVKHIDMPAFWGFKLNLRENKKKINFACLKKQWEKLLPSNSHHRFFFLDLTLCKMKLKSYELRFIWKWKNVCLAVSTVFALSFTILKLPLLNYIDFLV